MAPVLDFPDARFDAFRRTDRYGPLGHKPQPAVEYVRLSLAAVTLVPVKMALTLAVIVTHYVVCRLAWLVPARGGTRDRVLAAAGAVAARCALSTLGFTSVTRVPLAYAPGTGPTADAGAGHHANGGVNGENGDTTASHSPPLPGAVVSNHVGYCDILVHMAGGVSSFVARGATKDVPLVGVIR
jgi:lysophosphatidylcholine acyltransferase / lyso-PAF acetyltransferase